MWKPRSGWPARVPEVVFPPSPLGGRGFHHRTRQQEETVTTRRRRGQVGPSQREIDTLRSMGWEAEIPPTLGAATQLIGLLRNDPSRIEAWAKLVGADTRPLEQKPLVRSSRPVRKPAAPGWETTQAQRNYIRGLGWAGEIPIARREASRLIDQLQRTNKDSWAGRSVTNTDSRPSVNSTVDEQLQELKRRVQKVLPS